MVAARRCAVLLLMVLATACSGAGGEGDASGPSTGTDTALAASEPSPSPAASPSPSPTSRPAGSASSPGPLQPSEGFETATITLSSGEGRIRMPVWVADDPPLRQRGLMHRTSLPSDAGMLFVFEETTEGGFWMKNTLIPLSVAFLDGSGRVLEILDMQPCEADPCQVYTPGSTYRYALEANLGYFDDHGIGPGWTVEVGDATGAAG